MAWSDVILHARLILFFTDHAVAEPLADAREPLGSMEPRLKITGLHILTWIDVLSSWNKMYAVELVMASFLNSYFKL